MDSEFFEESNNFSSAEDIFSVLEALESASECNNPVPLLGEESNESFEFHNSAYNNSNNNCQLISGFVDSDETEEANYDNNNNNYCKRQKVMSGEGAAQPRVSHITVERNRRKQMNEHLTVLRSLMPCFYVKRGDQASIIGGVVNYISELQQVLQSLEAKKQRKAYADVLSPRPISSPRKPPLSPRTPQSSSPYKPILQNLQTTLNSPTLPSPVALSPCNSSTNSSINDTINELVASSKSDVAEVEVKFCGPNLMLKTVSNRIPGQVVKIVSALQDLPLEILQVNINKVDERMLNSFTIKIGIECQLSADELAQQIQQTFG